VAEARITHREGAGLLEETYRGTDGAIQQCPHCRRVRAVASATPSRWDFVPPLLERRGRHAFVTHALCPLCFAYHYHQHFAPDELSAVIDELMDGASWRH
jgi:hypothetical protein